jgi:excisionase family DNA binding protein
MTPDRERLLTTEDLGVRLRMPVESVQTLARRGELPGFKVGKAWRFRPSAIEKWERQREREAAS